MLVSFIIPLYNGLALTRECLRTLQATLPAGLVHEIILVDDGSTDGTREWLKTLAAPCRVLLNENNLGFAGTCNRGARAATGELLCHLNNDLILQQGWFEPLLAAHRAQGRRAGLTGNLQFRVDDGTLDHAGITVTTAAKLEHIRTLPTPARGTRKVFAVTAACCLVGRQVFLDAGGFDEGYLNGAEDVDFALRLGLRGLRCTVALESAIRHHVSAARGPTSRRDEANSRRLFDRWPAEIEVAVAGAWAAQPPATAVGTDLLSRLADRLCVAGLRKIPSRRAVLLARSSLWRETIRWQRLFGDGAAASEPAPLNPSGFIFDKSYPEAWIAESACFDLAPAALTRDLHVNGFLHPAAVGADAVLGLRVTVNGLQSRELRAVPAGNFSLGLLSPVSLPDRPTRVQIDLLLPLPSAPAAEKSGVPAGSPPDPLPSDSPARRLRFSQIVADDKVAVTFWNGARPGAADTGSADPTDPRLHVSWDRKPVVTGHPCLFAMRGWYELESNERRYWRWAGQEAEDGLWWDGSAPLPVRMGFAVEGSTGSRLRLFADGELLWQAPLVSGKALPQEVALTLPPGRTLLHWRLEGPLLPSSEGDTRRLGFMVENLRVSAP